MNIHLISANTKVDQSKSQKTRLQKLWEKSSHYHELVDSGEKADIIIVADLAGPDWFRDLRENAWVNRYPKKSFAISDSDFPFPLLHGIYTSATKSLPFRSRFRSAGYNLYPDEYLNPYLQKHAGNAYQHQKKYLYSFAGRDSSKVRLELFKLPKRHDIYIYNTTSQFAAFGQSPEPKLNWQINYVQVLNESKYALCPRGVSAASLRLFESLKMGVAPVILSDKWLFPEGPNWREFAIIVPECDANRVSDILKAYESEYVQRGALAREAYERYFSGNMYFDYLVDLCVGIRDSQKIPEKLFWSFRDALVFFWKINRDLLVP